MKKRLIWSKGWRNTFVITHKGTELRVKFLPGSTQWGVYVNGELKQKVENRDIAKSHAKNWYGEVEPSNTVACSACKGTGRVKKG